MKHINTQVLSGAAEKRETKSEVTKKFTIKEFKGIKETKKSDDDKTYNVFVKYEQISELDGEQTSEICNHTIKVKEKDNIKENIKDLIGFVLKNGYVIRVNILDVIVNKEIVQPDLYRYKGGKIEGTNIKYFKAWNATFNYHGYNLDINNETPFECVPNALYKMYGNDKTTKRDGFLRRIADGLDYVKNTLDAYNINPFDAGVDDVELKNKKGIYTSQYFTVL